MEWININEQAMPLETDIIVKHKYGVEAIHFASAGWKYWYTGKAVELETLKNITHWCKPE